MAKCSPNRLSAEIAEKLLPDSQCGFWPDRSTMDMICAHQIQETCCEHGELYMVFIDLTKTFDGVYQEALWSLFGETWVPR